MCKVGAGICENDFWASPFLLQHFTGLVGSALILMIGKSIDTITRRTGQIQLSFAGNGFVPSVKRRICISNKPMLQP
jgi:hypothetical protein